MPETTPLIKAALNLRGGAGFDVYEMKELFIRNILLIILEVSKDDDLDLPFC